MNTRERLMWIRLKAKMNRLWDASRHEDYVAKGLPDVSFGARAVNGWIELKCLPAWPAKASTPVRIPHYSQEQKNFLRERGQRGGRCWLLLKVGNEWLLYDYRDAILVGSLIREELIGYSTFMTTTEQFSSHEFLNAITSFNREAYEKSLRREV